MSAWQESTNGSDKYIWVCGSPNFSQVFATDGINIYKSTDGGNNYESYWTINNTNYLISQICCTSSILLVLANDTISSGIRIFNINTTLIPTPTNPPVGIIPDGVVILSIAISDQPTPLFFAVSNSFTYYTNDVTTWSTIPNLSGGFSIAVSNNVSISSGNIYVVGIDNRTVYITSGGYNGNFITKDFDNAGFVYCSSNSSSTVNKSLITTGYSGGTGILFSNNSGVQYLSNDTPLGEGVSDTISGGFLNEIGDSAVLITSGSKIYINNSGNFQIPFNQMTTPSSAWNNIVGNTDLSKMAASRISETPYFFEDPACYCEDSYIEMFEGEKQIPYIKAGDCIKIYGNIINNNSFEEKEILDIKIKWVGYFLYRGPLVCIVKNSLGINIPSKNVLVTPGHRIVYKNKFITAKDLLENINNINKVYYQFCEKDPKKCFHLETEKHFLIKTSNLLSETLLDFGDYKKKFQN